MRRNARALITIALIITICAGIVGFQKISIGAFNRGGDTPLGLSLGLDLQGGSHLVYEANLVDPTTGEKQEISKDQMQSLSHTIDRRINSSGLGEPIIQILGEDRLLVQLPGIRDPGRAKALIGETARLEFRHRTLNAPPQPIESIKPENIKSIKIDELREDGKIFSELDEKDKDDQTQELTSFPAVIVEFDETGSDNFETLFLNLSLSLEKAATEAAAGNFGSPADQIHITIDGDEELRFSTLANSIRKIGDTPRFGIAFPSDDTGMDGNIAVEDAKKKLGNNPEIEFAIKKGFFDEDIGLSGDDLKSAYAGQHQASGVPIVNIEFDDRGTRIFGELTTDIFAKQEETGVRDQIAILLDGQELISPVVNSPITAGTAVIQGGDFTMTRVKDLALLLESGRLPVPIELIQERDVDAILGADSLRKSVAAGFIGLGLVLIFMTLYYRVPGVVASVALIIYAVIVLAIFKIIPVTLTLSGVAAAILSIGMAVDANILIFERMKDELRAGRTMLSAINIGFNRAWPAIRDGNVSTLITCAILYWFSDQLGATIVQGFAVTLVIGVAISMFSAIVVSRTLMRVVALSPLSRKINLFTPTGAGNITNRESV
ncbi:MAG: protein translocase subunit SecD [SAR202 cluster bacterium]|nr:protein translocase subunit SecD [SAR202 cluster bacterium]